MTILEEIINYSKDCISGKIISCKKHIWACERFLRDVENQNTDEFPFVFSEDKAMQFIKWSRFFKHTKGVLRGKNIELHISLKFIVVNIYGWYHRDTGYRRFNKFFYQVARKNAKSQFVAIVASYELMVFLDGGLSEVYCAAGKKEQAKIVYSETKLMLDACTFLKGKWKEAYHVITHLKSKSLMKALSKEDKRLGDGLNPQCGIIDEYHAHDTSEMLDIIDSGMGARPEPLLGIITTAGFNLHYPCYRIEYKMVNQILNHDIDINLENYFCDVHELETNTSSEDIILPDGTKVAPGMLIDNPHSPDSWKKANPVICSYPEGIDYLRKKSEESTASPDKMRNFLTKHLNVWVNQREAGYMPIDRWSSCVGRFPDLKGQVCFVGLDLSAKIDLTSAAIIYPLDGKYIVKSHSFMPENKMFERMRTDKVPFDMWEKKGWITVTPGDVVDYSYVEEWVKGEVEKDNCYIEEWCLDPWGAVQLSNNLIKDGYTVVDIIQGIRTLSEPTKVFREEVYKNNIIHDGNPVLSWAIGNAVVDNVDRNENILLSKAKSTERIDPIAAVINAFVRAMVADNIGGTYERQGMRSF
jgi:phage terminase large subunit-like protein